VKEIIRAHSGKITVASEGDARGASFKIELPAYSELSKRKLKKLLKTERYN